MDVGQTVRNSSMPSSTLPHEADVQKAKQRGVNQTKLDLSLNLGLELDLDLELDLNQGLDLEIELDRQ